MEKVEKVNPYRNDTRSKDRQVADMFDAIAPAYDFMNAAMSFGMDRLWQRRLVEAAAAGNPDSVLDLATGTGEVALALARRLPQARISGLDISDGMLEQARAKKGAEGIEFICADGLSTGLPENTFDAITIAYGVRNYADLAAGLAEMHRILRPGGKVCVLELSEPANPILRALYKVYTRTLVPLVGRMVSGDSRAYTYLPESIAACPSRGAMTALMGRAGFGDCTFRGMTFGACTLYTAKKIHHNDPRP